MKKRFIIVLLAVLFCNSCGANKAIEPLRDAPIGDRDDSPADVFNMPDGFSNVASKCDSHGNRIFVAFKGDDNRAAIAVIKDSTCK